MHPENKLSSHVKQVVTGSKSHLSDVSQQQGLGSKGVAMGGHGVKVNQISPGLNSLGPSGVGGALSMLKTKAKRDRPVSMETCDPRETLANVEPDAKEGATRKKRHCVPDKKQPYSGDEWCSGAETDEDHDRTSTNRTGHRDHVVSGPSTAGSVGGQPSASLPGYTFGSGSVRSDMPRSSAQKMVYVFTTNLANSAAEAVMRGHADSILKFHQQNVPRTKLDQCVPATRKLQNSVPDPAISRDTPPTKKNQSQKDTARPGSAGAAACAPATGVSSSGRQPPEGALAAHQYSRKHCANSSQQTVKDNASPPDGAAPSCGSAEIIPDMAQPTAGFSPTSTSLGLPTQLQDEESEQGQCDPSELSKEQLERRERSLQTLRDIERLLLRSTGAGGNSEGLSRNPRSSHSNANNNDGMDSGLKTLEGNGNCISNTLPLGGPDASALKQYEEPLQSIMPQGLNLGTARSNPAEGPQVRLPMLPHQPLSSSPQLDLDPLQDLDGPTREQMAWRRLQEEYYQEKRQEREMQTHPHPQHYRMMAEMGMPRGSHFMMRGPPPPYHGKQVEHWGPGPVMDGGMGSNPNLLDIHPEGMQGSRFMGQMQRVMAGPGGNPISPGRMMSLEGLGLQRPGMGWVEDLPLSIGAGGRTLMQGCFSPGGPRGPGQPPHGDPEAQLIREEVLRIMERRQLQIMEQEHLAAQLQQEGLGHPRMAGNPSRPGRMNPDIGLGPPLDAMDFPQSRIMMDSSPNRMRDVNGPSLRDLEDGPLSMNLIMNANLNPQEQQMLVQRLQGGNRVGDPVADILRTEVISRLRAGQTGQGRASKAVKTEAVGSVQFPNIRFFRGEQSERFLLQQADLDKIGPDQLVSTQVCSSTHRSTGAVSKTNNTCQPPQSDVSGNVNPLGSPMGMAPSHPLKSPLHPEPSPLMPSPSASALKSSTPVPTNSPSHQPLPTVSKAGTLPSTPMKSPKMKGAPSLGMSHSPSVSPAHRKSPALNTASKTWMASPKTNIPSPSPNSKSIDNGTSHSSETRPVLPPRTSNSAVTSQPSDTSMPSPSSPPTQNPLSLIISQMSKYTMPGSAPLYHDTIKTIPSFDDELTTDRSILQGVGMEEGADHPSSQMLLSTQNAVGPLASPQSPIGMLLQGQQQSSHGTQGPMMPSPNMMNMSGMNSSVMDGGPCNVPSIHHQHQMMGFPRMQVSSYGPPNSSPQHFSQHPDDMLQQFHLLGKGLPHQQSVHSTDSFSSLRMTEGPDLSEVIRPSHTGIPEFDLSHIIPSDKPSSTLQYFPKGEGMSQVQQNVYHSRALQQTPPSHLLKQLSSSPHHSNTPSSNPHLANLQNMMMEQQQLAIAPSHYGIRTGMSQGGGKGVVVGPGGSISHPGQLIVRTGLQQQQQQYHQQQQQQMMMSTSRSHQPPHPHSSMMPPQQQHTQNLMAQQSLMMMQAKQRGVPIPREQMGPQGPLMSPQGLLMASSRPVMMGPQSLRQRGLPLNSSLDCAPGSVHNMPF